VAGRNAARALSAGFTVRTPSPFVTHELRQQPAGPASCSSPVSPAGPRSRSDCSNDSPRRHYDHAYEAHRQTELYLMGVYGLAIVTLRWEQGRLAEAAALPVGDQTMTPWARAALMMLRGEHDAPTHSLLEHDPHG
jgi:hypothetical protein